METVQGTTYQWNPSDRNPGDPFHYFGNIVAPYMETLSLSQFTIGLLVWLFSTPMVPNTQIDSQSSSPPLEQDKSHVDPKIDPLPSSPIVSSSLYSSSPS